MKGKLKCICIFPEKMIMSKMSSYHCAGSEHGVVKGTGEELVVGSVDGVAALEGDDVNTYREGGKVGAEAEWCRSVLEIEQVQSVWGGSE
jgi:hypothetical protein